MSGGSSPESIVIFFDDLEKNIENVGQRCPTVKLIHVRPDSAQAIDDAKFKEELTTNCVFNLIKRHYAEDPLLLYKRETGINSSHIAAFTELIGDKTRGTVVFDWDYTLNIMPKFYFINKYPECNDEAGKEAYIELLCGGKDRVKLLRSLIQLCDERGFRKIVLTSSHNALNTKQCLPNIEYFKTIIKQLVGSTTEIYHSLGPFPEPDLIPNDSSYDKGIAFINLRLCPPPAHLAVSSAKPTLIIYKPTDPLKFIHVRNPSTNNKPVFNEKNSDRLVITIRKDSRHPPIKFNSIPYISLCFKEENGTKTIQFLQNNSSFPNPSSFPSDITEQTVEDVLIITTSNWETYRSLITPKELLKDSDGILSIPVYYEEHSLKATEIPLYGTSVDNESLLPTRGSVSHIKYGIHQSMKYMNEATKNKLYTIFQSINLVSPPAIELIKKFNLPTVEEIKSFIDSHKEELIELYPNIDKEGIIALIRTQIDKDAASSVKSHFLLPALDTYGGELQGILFCKLDNWDKYIYDKVLPYSYDMMYKILDQKMIKDQINVTTGKSSIGVSVGDLIGVAQLTPTQIRKEEKLPSQLRMCDEMHIEYSVRFIIVSPSENSMMTTCGNLYNISFIGGRVETNESALEGAKREFCEEIGLTEFPFILDDKNIIEFIFYNTANKKWRIVYIWVVDNIARDVLAKLPPVIAENSRGARGAPLGAPSAAKAAGGAGAAPTGSNREVWRKGAPASSPVATSSAATAERPPTGSNSEVWRKGAPASSPFPAFSAAAAERPLRGSNREVWRRGTLAASAAAAKPKASNGKWGHGKRTRLSRKRLRRSTRKTRKRSN